MSWRHVACSLVAAIAFSGCGSTETEASEWQTIVDGMVDLTQMQGGFSAGTAVLDDFDVNSYFTVLDHLRMREGYTLDWVYTAGELEGSQFVLEELPTGAQPVLYARRLDQDRFRTFEEYQSSLTTPWDWNEVYPRYLDYVDADGTDESYFQLVVLHLLGDRFYLYWHALYGELAVVCDRSTIDRSIDGQLSGYGSPPLWLRLRAHLLNVTPVVEQTGDTATVRVVTLSRFEGFVRRSFTINKAGQPRLAGVEDKVLIANNIGIVY